MNNFVLITTSFLLLGSSINAHEHESGSCTTCKKHHLPTVEQSFHLKSEIESMISDLSPKTCVQTPEVVAPYAEAVVKTITHIDSEDGSITLGDGSRWSVWFHVGRKEVKTIWQEDDEVVITFNPWNFWGTPAVLHNLSKGLSVYSLLSTPPKPDAFQSVTITSIDQESGTFTTSASTIIQLSDPESILLSESCVSDLLILMLPVKGVSDGSKVFVWNIRLHDLSIVPSIQLPIE